MDKQIWDGILDSDRMARYAIRVHEHHAKRQARLEYMTVGLSVVLAGFLVAMAVFGLEAVAGAVAAIISSAATVVSWQFRQRYATKSAIAEMTATQYTLLVDDWTRVWYQGKDRVDPAEVSVLRARYTTLGSYLSDPIDKKLHSKAEKESNRVIPGRFQASGREAEATA